MLNKVHTVVANKSASDNLTVSNLLNANSKLTTPINSPNKIEKVMDEHKDIPKDNAHDQPEKLVLISKDDDEGCPCRSPGKFHPVNVHATGIEHNASIVNKQPKFEVVTTIPYVLVPKNKVYQNLSKQQKEKRMKEFMSCLRKTLDHPYVANIHIFYDDERTKTKILEEFTAHKDRLVFQFMESLRYEIMFKYIGDNLTQRLVMLMHGDMYPAYGFYQVNFANFYRERLMYALTRRIKYEAECDMKTHDEHECEPDGLYLGSHDAFLFVAPEPFPDYVIDAWRTHQDLQDIDSLTIKIFKSLLCFKVLNPCNVIKFYHIHCIAPKEDMWKKSSKLTACTKVYPSDDLL